MRLFISAFYDANNDAVNNLDESSEFKKRVTIKVIRKVKPLHLHLSIDQDSPKGKIINLYNSQDLSSSIQATLYLTNPNNSGSWGQVSQWTDTVSYKLLDAKTFQSFFYSSLGISTDVIHQTYDH